MDLQALLLNPVFLVFAWLTLTNIVMSIGYYRYKTNKAEFEASLKMEMIQRGMSADDIQKVLAAPVRKPKSEKPATDQTGAVS